MLAKAIAAMPEILLFDASSEVSSVAVIFPEDWCGRLRPQTPGQSKNLGSNMLPVDLNQMIMACMCQVSCHWDISKIPNLEYQHARDNLKFKCNVQFNFVLRLLPNVALGCDRIQPFLIWSLRAPMSNN